MVIYEIYCKNNKKSYIEQTSWGFRKRKLSHISALRRNCHANAYLQNAWNKYGEKSFVFSIIDEATTIQELNKKETEWIKKKNSLMPYGFNCELGGGNATLSETTKNKISESLRSLPREVHLRAAKRREKAIGMYTKEFRLLKVFSSAQKAAKHLNVAESTINSAGRRQLCRHGYMWKYLNDKWTQKKNTSRDQMIWQYSLDGKFVKSYISIEEAEKQTGLFRNHIVAVANGRRKSHKGYMFFYERNNNVKYDPIEIKKPINQLTLDGILVQRYDSVKEAAEAVGTYPSGLSACLNGVYNTYKGYKWEYV